MGLVEGVFGVNFLTRGRPRPCALLRLSAFGARPGGNNSHSRLGTIVDGSSAEARLAVRGPANASRRRSLSFNKAAPSLS